MDIRKLIKEEVQRVVLNESYKGYASVPVPTTFNHLKWSFNVNQKYYLQDLCNVDPKSITESNIKGASQFLGIPEKNVKSIVNTYNSYDPNSESVIENSQAEDSSFRLGGKPATLLDIGVDDIDRLPVRANRTTYPMQDSMTQMEKKTMGYAIKKNRVLDRSGNASGKEQFYESVHTSLMMYLFCEVKPKDIKLNHRNQIQIDQEPVLLEGESFNMENHSFRRVNDLLKSFNKMFNTSFRIAEHVDLSEAKSRCHRTMVEHFGIADDKLFWCKEAKSWVGPGSASYSRLREEYIRMQGQQMAMPEIPKVNHEEMLKKYFSGDLISYNPNSEWL
jgi:hypothetical protein